MSYIFDKCPLLLSLPDIYKWNTNNLTNMSNMHDECLSLLSLYDILRLNTNNEMSFLFDSFSIYSLNSELSFY